MTRLRYDHILAGTALALILAAIPAGSLAQNADKTAPLPAASPAEQQAIEAPSANPTLAQPAVAVDPIASLDPAERPVAEKIRDFFSATSDRIFTNKKERAAAEAFYQSRNYAPLWLDNGIENARASSAIARLKNADADGLELSDYKIPTFAGLAPEALAEADLKLTQTVLTYARHVQAGRFPYTRVSRNIELPQAAPEPADILRRASALPLVRAGHGGRHRSAPRNPCCRSRQLAVRGACGRAPSSAERRARSRRRGRPPRRRARPLRPARRAPGPPRSRVCAGRPQCSARAGEAPARPWGPARRQHCERRGSTTSVASLSETVHRARRWGTRAGPSALPPSRSRRSRDRRRDRTGTCRSGWPRS